MPPPSTEDRRAIWSWYCYDFANSPFTTLVVTFIYAAFFANVIGADYYVDSGLAASGQQAIALGTALWSRGITLTALVVALLSPLMGALADRGGYRKPFLAVTTAVAVGGCVELYRAPSDRVFLALTAFVVANIAFEMGMVFYNAFLPDIAPPEKIGRVSGNGWGLGYAGGLLVLLISLVAVMKAGVSWRDNASNVATSNLLVAVWFVVFSLPIFLWVKEDKSRVSKGGQILGETVRQLKETFHEIRKYRQTVRFLVARLVYNDGLVTIFAFGGIYAAGTFGFTPQELLVFAIVLNATAGLGAAAMGVLDDRIGGKKTIQLSIVALAAATLIAVLAPNKVLFWVAGILIGIFSGPNQASSRSLMGRFVPADKENEFFGFFAFSGKATAFMGPFLLGLATAHFGSQRAGVATLILFFVAGFWLLSRVDEEEGKAAAGRPGPAR